MSTDFSKGAQKRKRRRVRRAFDPDFSTLLTLCTLAALTPLLVLAHIKVGFLIPYAAYLLALYVLLALFGKLPHLFLAQKDVLTPRAFFRALKSDAARARLALPFGMLANLAFAAFRLVTGLFYRSFWFAAEAIYYIILSLIRYLLSKKETAAKEREAPERLTMEWEAYRRTAQLLLLQDVSLGGIVLSVLLEEQTIIYPGYVLSISAIFTFFRVALSLRQIARFRKRESPALLSSKALSLCGSLLSVFTTQATVLSLFGKSSAVPFFNAAAGGAAFLTLPAIAVFMLKKAKRQET